MIQHLAQLREQAAENSLKKVTLFNPTNEEFEWTIVGVPYVIHQHAFGEFDYNPAQILKKHLVDLVVSKYGNSEGPMADDSARERALKEIEVIKSSSSV